MAGCGCAGSHGHWAGEVGVVERERIGVCVRRKTVV